MYSSTLFVSNLPYTATSTDLQTLFSDIAPVRSAFVVLEQGTSVSKGVGYVSFAIREDAQSAYDKITSEGSPCKAGAESVLAASKVRCLAHLSVCSPFSEILTAKRQRIGF